MYVCMYVCMYIYIYIYIHTCVYIYIYTHTHVQLCISLSLVMYMCTYLSLSLYIYIYIFTCSMYVYIYIYTYIYINGQQASGRFSRRLEEPRRGLPHYALRAAVAELRVIFEIRGAGSRNGQNQARVHPVPITRFSLKIFCPRVGLPRNLCLIGSLTAALRFSKGWVRKDLNIILGIGRIVVALFLPCTASRPDARLRRGGCEPGCNR